MDGLFGESDIIVNQAGEVHHVADDGGGYGTIRIEQPDQQGVPQQFEHAIGNARIAYRSPLPV